MEELYSDLKKEIKVLGDDLVARAGNIMDIGTKKQWLTEDDIKIERRISEIILNKFPDHKIFAEELNTEFTEGENVWVIDPISHTFNYIHGLKHYAICVSHLQKNQVVFACIYDPSVDEMFTAQKGAGAFLNNQKIKVSPSNSDLCILFDSDYQKKYKEEVNAKLFTIITQTGRHKTIGSLGIHYCYVACGRAEAAIHLTKDAFPEYAGKLILEEAGGKMTDFAGNDLNIETREVLATNGTIHQILLDKLKALTH